MRTYLQTHTAPKLVASRLRYLPKRESDSVRAVQLCDRLGAHFSSLPGAAAGFLRASFSPTNSMMEIGALSPRRLPTLMMRV